MTDPYVCHINGLPWTPSTKTPVMLPSIYHTYGSVMGYTTWWFIPLSKWVITLVINGISGVSPLITRVITHLLSGMNHQVVPSIVNPMRPAPFFIMVILVILTTSMPWQWDCHYNGGLMGIWWDISWGYNRDTMGILIHRSIIHIYRFISMDL